MARGELTPQEIENRKIISENLKKLLLEKKSTQVDIHRITKIPKSTLTGYFKGTSTPNPGNIQKLANYFNVPKSVIDPRFRQKDEEIFSKMRKAIKTVSIPVLGTITCGNPITAEQNISEYREELEDLLPSGNVFYLKTSGDSMTPTIPEDSYVLIREQPEVEDGEIAAVLLNGDTEATLKRVKHQGNLILLVPDNPKYSPYVINEENPARIIGKAVKVSFDL
ncbi:LexA family transcriptional regulator [Vagococcus entomophilus]|uniref:XRE family transcriptional regulator n=1 Tax=Vagococcus entomophilus TaxID=1160095 RepID=A0A430AKD8_9ENTE|nr:XRE family transcriptional regulator [Vagococcus entomophilus]RSU08473.1 XRE family transcriptional regulator [Vagococcus entomophilus]